jgi:hypothetical protein
MKPWFAALFTLPFAGAYTLGAFGSQDPLVRLACRLAIVIFVLAALLSFWMTAARLHRVQHSWPHVGLICEPHCQHPCIRWWGSQWPGGPGRLLLENARSRNTCEQMDLLLSGYARDASICILAGWRASRLPGKTIAEDQVTSRWLGSIQIERTLWVVSWTAQLERSPRSSGAV